MLLLEFRFPAGRYHATPWGRNVNEGVVEWPPSPYRLARALVDVCHRRRPDWSDERLQALLEPLSNPPKFRLPLATASHTRAFLNSNKKDPTKKQKIFDSFVVIDRGERLLAGFECSVSNTVRADLDDLLGELNYLGRSESWVRARVLEQSDEVEFNCGLSDATDIDYRSERVTVACLKTIDEHKAQPNVQIDWLDAIRLSSKDLLHEGWSAPPALKELEVLRPGDALKPTPRRHAGPLTSRFSVARYALSSTVLPRVTETVAFAERIRSKLMGIHRRVMSDDPSAVSPLFSGKNLDGSPIEGHQHAFYLPLDEDGDGRIDHLTVRVTGTFGATELDALDRLRSIWQSDGRPDIKLVLVSLAAELPGRTSTKWVSATPFVTRRHHRKGRGAFHQWISAEVRRECAYHGLPEPVSIEWVDRTQSTGHQIRWIEFMRSRKGERPLQGHGCILTFDEQVRGPFALGALCHFGLGLFVASEE